MSMVASKDDLFPATRCTDVGPAASAFGESDHGAFAGVEWAWNHFVFNHYYRLPRINQVLCK